MSTASSKSRENIAVMLQGIERYNPNNLAELEEYVSLQLKENFYDLEANLAVLKLYQFIPDRFSVDVCVKIFTKALTNMPKSDFVLCKCLVDQAHFEDDGIKMITTLHQYLETCQFKSFWDIVNDHKEKFDNVAGFHESIRTYIYYIINMTYQRVEKKTIAELLNVTIGELAGLMQKNGWKDDEGGYLFISNQEERVKNKNITEKIEFENVFNVIAGYR